ncbi:MAG TPA: hypothetical protein VN436_11760, partial [Holophaga sp.]|nr:hypothetical protein [Holophaga sp.]
SRRFLLECLYACHQKKVRTGRRSLHQQALAHDLYLSEAQIRKLLLQMEWMGHVQLGSGRGGTTITRAGIEALQRMDRP